MRLTEEEYQSILNKSKNKKSSVTKVSDVITNDQTTSNKLVLPYPPSANVMWRTTRTGKTYLSPEAKAYKLKVAELAAKQSVKRIDGEVILYVDIFRPQKSGDLDNRLKAALDSIKDIAFEDDKFVVEIHARRFDDKACPRIEVRVQSAIKLADQLF